jgi:DNA-binding transcriptional LysR family regulator
MNTVHLAALDLNLLRVFEALTEEESVTRAAQRLGLTPSAVSHALSRLRYALGDDLFVRTPRGMRPTTRAAEIAPRVIDALRGLYDAFAPEQFAPGETDRRFTLEAGPYVSAVLVPEVMRRVSAKAPGATVRIRNSLGRALENLDAGRADLALGPLTRAPERFGRALLFKERMVWAVRADHPLTKTALTLEGIGALPRVVLSVPVDGDAARGTRLETGIEPRVVWDDAAVGRALAVIGRAPRIALEAPDAQTALAVVARTDMAAFVPRRLVLAHRLQGLALFDPPGARPVADMAMFWRKDRDAPALSWLREEIIASAAALQEAAPG